jgi:hemin uptake protein HemP
MVPDLPAAESAIVEMTNEFRKGNNLAIVRIDPKLSSAARRYAEFLAASRLMSHTADGRRPVDRVKAAGYDACQTSENLAMFMDSRGFETRQLARKMVEGWKNSPGHRKNMLQSSVTDVGIAIAKARGELRYYSVQLFGRPESQKYRFEIQNRSNVDTSFTFSGKQQLLKQHYGIRLTACQRGTLSIKLPGGDSQAFIPDDGSTYTLKRSRGGKLRILTGTLERLKLQGGSKQPSP